MYVYWCVLSCVLQVVFYILYWTGFYLFIYLFCSFRRWLQRIQNGQVVLTTAYLHVLLDLTFWL